jgi:hypothetical protein
VQVVAQAGEVVVPARIPAVPHIERGPVARDTVSGATPVAARHRGNSSVRPRKIRRVASTTGSTSRSSSHVAARVEKMRTLLAGGWAPAKRVGEACIVVKDGLDALMA